MQIDQMKYRHALLDLGVPGYVLAARVGIAPSELSKFVLGQRQPSPELVSRTTAPVDTITQSASADRPAMRPNAAGESSSARRRERRVVGATCTRRV